MKITRIVQQEKRKDRYSVYVDDKYGFSLSESALLSERLATGQEFDAAKLKAYKQLSADDKLYGNALRYAVMRPRSEWELRDYLRRKLADEPVAQTIMQRLTGLELVDDHRFAEVWVENRRLLKPVSKRRLTQELKQRRVSDDIITTVLREDEADEREVLKTLVVRKQKQTKYQDPQKLAQYLARQGFGYDDIKAVLQDSA